MSISRVEGYLRAADIAGREGKPDQVASALRLAAQAAEELPECSPAHPLVLVARADAAVRAGDRPAAAALLEEACALDDRCGVRDADAVVRRLRAALACEAAGGRDRARALAAGAVEMAAKDAPALSGHAGEVLARLTGQLRPAARRTPSPSAPAPAPGAATMAELQARLDALVGLAAVKEEVRKLVALAEVGRARAAAGLPAGERTRHLVFTGAPGTGKTTVARILGEMYGVLGVVGRGHLVEATRADLVAGYVGQTAPRVNALVDTALGGVLFIDEAYSLAGGGEEDFGREALAELVKRMEDDRSRLVVILAGYDAEMQAMLDVNPGLRSRVQSVLTFSDYTPEELAEVFTRMAATDGWKLDDAARAKAAATLAEMHAAHDRSWANARTARGLLEATLARHALRVTADGKITPDELDHLVAGDVPDAQPPSR
jgi:hypothetical protein